MTPENSYVRKSGEVNCRQCRRELNAEHRRRRGARTMEEFRAQQKLACKNGHPRSPENTESGACKICKRANDKEYRLGRAELMHARMRLGIEVRCPRGHKLTPKTLTKYGVCAHCRHEYNVTHKRPAKFRLGGDVCKNGHPRTPENTYVAPRGWQVCRICMNASAAKRRRSLDPLVVFLEDAAVAREHGCLLGLDEYRQRYAEAKAQSRVWTERRERINEAGRFRKERARRKAGANPRNFSPATIAKQERARALADGARRVPPGPLLGWLTGRSDIEAVAERAGSSERFLRSIRDGVTTKVNIGLVDRLLLAAGEPPALLDELYPLEVAA